MTAKRIAIDDIRADGGTQTRAELRPDVIEEYAEAMRRGDEFPPIDVFHDKAGQYWLADGFHRFNGAASAELPDIRATIHKGELRDAIWFALSANSRNGIRRTPDDKKRCIAIAIGDKEWQQKPDRELAEHIGVSQQYVNRLRNELTTAVVSSNSKQEKKLRKGKDGKSRPAKYKKRTAKVAPAPEPPAASNGQPFDGKAAAAPAAFVASPKPAEPNIIGGLIERYDAFVEELIAGQPPYVIVLLKEHSADVWKEI